MQKYQIKLFFSSKTDGNLAFHVNDAKESVIQNHQVLAQKLGYDFNKLVHMKQIHSDIVHRVTDADNFNNPPTCDALVTNKKHIPLMVMVADCTPVILHDSKNGVIAVAHVGRAGAFKNILKNTLNVMLKYFNTNIKDIYITIGPSIGSCCYEVGSEIVDEVKKLHLTYAIEKKEKKTYLDIAKIIHRQLNEQGISIDHIIESNECNCCKKEKYFSYRASPKTGRFTGVVYLI